MTTIQDDVRKELGEDVFVSDCDGYWMIVIDEDRRIAFGDTLDEAMDEWRSITLEGKNHV